MIKKSHWKPFHTSAKKDPQKEMSGNPPLIRNIELLLRTDKPQEGLDPLTIPFTMQRETKKGSE